MYRKFETYLKESGMASLLQNKGAVLAAYSGGADSTLMLFWFHRYCITHGIHLYAAHVHHGIRGAEADRDAEHCRRTAESLQIPLYTAWVDVPSLAKEKGLGIEECARAERYAYLDRICASLGMPDMPVATAHNADDQLETVLFHMLRGSGLAGMSGILPIRENRYIRPLLSFSGDSIRQICQAEGLLFVEDSTNADTVYTRNYIRHEIVPVLRKLNPNPEEAAVRMTKLLARDNDCLDQKAADCLSKMKDGTVEREVLRKVHPAIGTRVLRLAYEALSEGMCITAEQTEQLYNLAVSEEGAIKYLSLPGCIRARVNREAVVFIPDGGAQEEKASFPQEINIPSIAPEETVILDWEKRKIVLSRKSLPDRPENLENIYNLSIQQPINFAKIKGVLCLRTRKAGDTIRYGGIARKIRKLQNEYHIPPEKRDTMLILADEEEVLWAEGLNACDKVRNEGEDLLRIGIWDPAAETHDIKNSDRTTEADHETEDRPG